MYYIIKSQINETLLFKNKGQPLSLLLWERYYTLSELRDRTNGKLYINLK